MERCNSNEDAFVKKQYVLCLEWFEFITNDIVNDGKYTVQYCNVILSQFMSTMERAFHIPLLLESFEEWSLDYPEISELYRKASDARDFSIYPDASEDTFQLDHDGDSCIDWDCYDESEESETDKIAVDLGKRIKRIREAKRLTQAQLGEMIGIKEIGIRQYEIGRNAPREDRLKEIANALGVSWQWLVTGNLDAETRKTVVNLNKANILEQRDNKGRVKNGNVR